MLSLEQDKQKQSLDKKRYFIISNYAHLYTKEVRCLSSVSSVLRFAEQLRLCHSDIILDIGLGEGRLIPVSSPSVAKYIGIDISNTMLTLAKEHAHNRQNAFLIQADAESLPLKSSVFAKVACLYTSSYIPNQQIFLNEVFRVLQPHGLFIATFHNASSVKTSATLVLIEVLDLALKLLRRISARVQETIARFLFVTIRALGLFPYRDEKCWAISFLRYGITPFQACSYSFIHEAYKLAGLRIVETSGSKRNSSFSVLATKDRQ